MSKLVVGIISYLGHTDAVRSVRLPIHNDQLKWFKKQGFKPSEVIVASQYYRDTDYNPDLATYWDCTFPEAKLKPGAARNFLLNQFYKSDADWFILADNDSVLDDRNKGDIIEWLRENDQDRVPCFVPVAPNVPGQGAWKDYFKNNDKELNENWIFERGKTKTSFMFLRNLKKHYGIEQYFDDGVRFVSGEDWAFGFDLIKKGLPAMWCRNIILKEMGGMKASGTWKAEGDSRTHADFQPILRENFAREYARDGIEDTGELSMRGFYKKYPVTNQDIWITKNTNSDDKLFLF